MNEKSFFTPSAEQQAATQDSGKKKQPDKKKKAASGPVGAVESFSVNEYKDDTKQKAKTVSTRLVIQGIFMCPKCGNREPRTILDIKTIDESGRVKINCSNSECETKYTVNLPVVPV